MIFRTLNSSVDETNSFELIPGNDEEKKLYFTENKISLCEINDKIYESIFNNNFENFIFYLDLKMECENEFVTR